MHEQDTVFTTSVAAEDESGLFGSSKLVVSIGHNEYEFEFRGSDKAHHAYQLIVGMLVE